MNTGLEKNSKMKKLFIICLLFIFSTNSLHAQNKIIKGRVIDEQLETLPYVSILIDDTVKIGKTDLNGFFQISLPITRKNIVFNTIGIDLTSIELTDKCDEVEVIMLSSGTYDFITPKKIDRRRKKRFKKLPELHRAAFEKGLFKTANVCYTQEFIYHFDKKRKR